MRKRPLAVYLCAGLTLVLLFAYQPSIFAQGDGLDCAQLRESNDFPFLASTKGSLSAQIQTLKTRIASLPSEIEDAADIEEKKDDLEELRRKERKTAEDETRIEQLEFYLDAIPKVSKDLLEKELASKQAELDAKEALLQCVEQRISTIRTPEQNFKLLMSLAGATLILLVIGGFFVLAFKDESIRRAIFSGNTGIQFLTLFSIVIAIILFGITGVLQDKELAALLGGLSGYILGRYNNSGDSNGGQSNQAPQSRSQQPSTTPSEPSFDPHRPAEGPAPGPDEDEDAVDV